jgi:hypothetical protein
MPRGRRICRRIESRRRDVSKPREHVDAVDESHLHQPVVPERQMVAAIVEDVERDLSHGAIKKARLTPGRIRAIRTGWQAQAPQSKQATAHSSELPISIPDFLQVRLIRLLTFLRSSLEYVDALSSLLM